MGLFSSSKSHTTNVSESNAIAVQGDNSSPIISKSQNVHIETVDDDIVEDALNFARHASDNASDSLDKVGTTLKEGFKTALDASKSSDERNTQSLFKTLNTGMYVAGAVALGLLIYSNS